MTILHSPRAVELAKQMATFEALAKMSGAELDRREAAAAGHGRAFALASLACLVGGYWSLVVSPNAGLETIFGISTLVLAFVLFIFSLSSIGEEKCLRCLDGESDAQKVHSIMRACSAAREWRAGVIHSERFMRVFDLRAMELIAEIQKAESDFQNLNFDS